MQLKDLADTQTINNINAEAERRGMSPEEFAARAIRHYLSTEYLTRAGVAQELSVTERTVFNWTRNGLPHAKIGGVTRILRADLDAFINLHRVNSARV